METENKDIQKVEDISSIVRHMSQGFTTIDENKMKLIESRMGEIDRSLRHFAKRNTQIDLKLRTLTMLSTGAPYRTLRQIIVQIETKRSALSDSYFKILRWEEIINRLRDSDDKLDKIKCAKYQVGINASSAFIEATLKDIGMLQTAYEEIVEHHNLPENWNELDMEKEEIAHHIKGAFRNGLRDMLCNARIGMGTVEWFEQFGISPIEAREDIINFLQKNQKDYEAMMDFIDSMALKYKDHYLKAMERIGLKSLLDKEWMNAV